MKILAKTRGISKMDIYKLMSPKEYVNMRDVIGETINIKQFVLYQESDEYNGQKNVLSIRTKDDDIIVSASTNLCSEFEKLILIFGVNFVQEIEILSQGTVGGFDVLTCRLPGMGDE